MEFEQSGVPDTEVERERVSVMVQAAYQAWSENPADPEAIKQINYALNEAYGTGVGIAIKLSQEGLESPDIFNPAYKEFEPSLEDDIVINSLQDISPRKIRGQVTVHNETSYLSLDLHLTRLNYSVTSIALIKPEEIASFTPVEPEVKA